MSGEVLQFRRPGIPAEDPGRFDALHRDAADANRLAAELGTPEEWAASAIDHLKVASCGATSGHVSVSSAALHVALAHIEHLERRLGVIPAPRGVS